MFRAKELAETADRLIAGCERLVHAAVADAAERRGHARAMALLLAMPFPAILAVAPFMMSRFDGAFVLGAACALTGAFWALSLALSWSGNIRLVAGGALALGLALAGMTAFLAGGLSSPALALALALPIETWRLSRSPRLGGAVLVATLGALAAGAMLAPGGPVAAGAWQWLAPLLYGLALCGRMSMTRMAEEADRAPTRFGAVADHLDASFLAVNAAGEVAVTGGRCMTHFGVAPEMLLGAGFFERLHVADRVGFLCALSQMGEGTPARLALRVRVPAGGYRAFEAEFLPGAEAGETLLALRGTEREEALADELAIACARIEEAEISKGRFLASVSHELRTPLNAIIGFSDLLLSPQISGVLPPRQSEQIGLIRQAGDHLLSVVNAILDVSKVEAGTYPIAIEPFALEKAVDLSCRMMEPQAAERNVTLTTRVPASVGEVPGDQRAIQQILINLISNAVKFTPEGGAVRISACRSRTHVSLRVSDNGIGIAQEDMEKLGQPFMQVQNDYTRKFQGTGLGLSLVKGLVRLHGGTLAIESAPGLGTSVTVSLPMDGTTHENENEPPTVEPLVVDGKERTVRTNGATLLKIA